MFNSTGHASEICRTFQAKKFVPPPKITRAQIQETQEQLKQEQQQQQPAKKATAVADEDDGEPIPENVNRLQFEGETASTIDEALDVLK